jgi:hypothetical protein
MGGIGSCQMWRRRGPYILKQWPTKALRFVDSVFEASGTKETLARRYGINFSIMYPVTSDSRPSIRLTGRSTCPVLTWQFLQTSKYQILTGQPSFQDETKVVNTKYGHVRPRREYYGKLSGLFFHEWWMQPEGHGRRYILTMQTESDLQDSIPDIICKKMHQGKSLMLSTKDQHNVKFR